MIISRHPSAVVFDLNDTLIYGGDRDPRDAVSRAMARDLGVDPDAFATAIRDSFDARCRGTLGDLNETISRLAAGLGARPTTAAVRAAAERRLSFARSLLIPDPRVLEMLDRLRRRGYRLGLISGCSAETPALWRGTALAERFDAAVFSCEMGARKPDPSLYLAAAAGLGVAAGECLYVGDGASSELAGAQRAGMAALRLGGQATNPATEADRRELYGVRPWDGPVIDDIAELASLLDARRSWVESGTVRDTAIAVRPVAMLVDSCHRVLPLLRLFVLAERWTQPSVLEHWSIAGLAGHLARSAFNLERALDTASHSREQRPALDAVGYYAAWAPDGPGSPIGRRIRELGDAEAAAGPQALADRFAASTARLRERALPMDPGTTVEMFNRVLPIDDCAAACLLELVIHADDLAVSLGLQPLAFDEQAADLVTITLTRISRKRHGDTAVIRALARTERSPAGGISAF